MKPVEFKGCNKVFGKGQEGYQPLPAIVLDDKQGTVITGWELSEKEREEVQEEGIVYLQQLTFGRHFQPVYLTSSLGDILQLDELGEPIGIDKKVVVLDVESLRNIMNLGLQQMEIMNKHLSFELSVQEKETLRQTINWYKSILEKHG